MLDCEHCKSSNVEFWILLFFFKDCWALVLAGVNYLNILMFPWLVFKLFKGSFSKVMFSIQVQAYFSLLFLCSLFHISLFQYIFSALEVCGQNLDVSEPCASWENCSEYSNPLPVPGFIWVFFLGILNFSLLLLLIVFSVVKWKFGLCNM